MEAPRSERSFATLGPALRLLGLALLIAGGRSGRSAWLALHAIAGGPPSSPLPDLADALFGLGAIAAGAFFLRQADENAQALAGGGRVLPPMTLLRLVQPRFEHPLRELWSRSDPGASGEPMPGSRVFGALWGLGLAIALPLWAFVLVAPGEVGVVAQLADAAHHIAIVVACGAAFYFAALMAQRQEEAWSRVKPSVMVVPVRVAGPRKEAPAIAAAAAPATSAAQAAAPAAASVPPPPAPAAATYPPPARESFSLPDLCPLCGEAIAERRCGACGAPARAGPFLIVQALGGRGGRRTFLAVAPDGARVVLKELSLAGAPDAQALEAFAREARMLRELRHPRLPTYVDAFQEGEGAGVRLYLAYRYLDGISLREEMEQRRYTEDEVLDLVEEVLEILRHLHGLQPPLIHRDLKPANLVRRRDGTLALIDFGVARELEKTLNSGTLVGTVGYMPPEQLAGQVDITSDLHALGATALHMLVRLQPWEFMDGPELRLPPLKTAPVARAFLRRVLAPRRAQRFASAREALSALKRMRAGGSSFPRAAWAAAGVAAATLTAVAVGADRRFSAAEAQNRRVPEVVEASVAKRPAPVPQPPAVPAPQPPPPGAQELATWRGGALTRADIEEGLRRLPPWLKSDQPWWIQQHVLAQVRRKLLAAEAEKRGLPAPPSAVGPERERLLGRALLEIEASKESKQRPARAVRKAWERVTGALYAAAEVRLDEPEIFRIEPQKMVGSPPAPATERAAPGRLEFAAKTGLCIVEVEPSQRRYGGRCEALEMLSEALLDPDTLQLVDLAPRSVLPAGFYARYTDDFIENRQLGANGLETADAAERSLTHADIRLSEATGTVSPTTALDLLEVARPALRRCLALALQQASQRPMHLQARIRVELRPGAPAVARIESEPPLGPRACARALARPELGGTGQLTFFADLERRGSGAARHVEPLP